MWLLPERAIFWPRRNTLFVADAHFGKAAAFRAGGLPVPVGTTSDNLRRLSDALSRTGARRLVCLGDLLHARAGRADQLLQEVAAWRALQPTLQWLLVRGNHDRHAGDPPIEWNVDCVEEPFEDPPFVLRHLPQVDPAGHILAGHLHPAVRVGRGKLSETLPCFYLGKRMVILPAFGAFTGTATVRPAEGDRVVVIADGELVPLQ